MSILNLRANARDVVDLMVNNDVCLTANDVSYYVRNDVVDYEVNNDVFTCVKIADLIIIIK